MRYGIRTVSRIQSHPVRVRGLKPAYILIIFHLLLSHPVRVRGLKHGYADGNLRTRLSHPVRVRGLKLLGQIDYQTQKDVAPRAGAWIETKVSL